MIHATSPSHLPLLSLGQGPILLSRCYLRCTSRIIKLPYLNFRCLTVSTIIILFYHTPRCFLADKWSTLLSSSRRPLHCRHLSKIYTLPPLFLPSAVFPLANLLPLFSLHSNNPAVFTHLSTGPLPLFNNPHHCDSCTLRYTSIVYRSVCLSLVSSSNSVSFSQLSTSWAVLIAIASWVLICYFCCSISPA